MTTQAIVSSLETGQIGLLLGECVENDAFRWIVRCNLDKSSPHPSDHHRIVKEDRARVARLDEICLQAGFRENRNLRLNGNVQRVKHGSQISLRSVELQPGGTH